MPDPTPEHEAKARELLWPLDFYDSSGDADCGAYDGDFTAVALALAEAEERGRESERAAREAAERECARLREALAAPSRYRVQDD